MDDLLAGQADDAGHGEGVGGLDLNEASHDGEVTGGDAAAVDAAHLMGGYFPGRPGVPESGPAKTQEAQAGLHFKQHGLDKEQAGQPVTSQHNGKDTVEPGVQIQPGVPTWKEKT